MSFGASRGNALQDILQAGHIVGLVPEDMGAPGPGDPCPGDDAGVVLLVGDQIFALLDEGGDHALVRQEARREGQAGLDPQKIGQLFLQGRVEDGGSVEIPRAGAARPEGLDGLHRGLDHFGVLGQAQVVVASGHDDLPAFHPDDGTMVLLDGLEIREDPRVDDLFRPRELPAFLEQVHVFTSSKSFGLALETAEDDLEAQADEPVEVLLLELP